MNNYLNYMRDISSPETFKRKINYIDYNFKKIIPLDNAKGLSVLEIGPGLGEALRYLNDRKIYSIDVIDNNISILKNIESKYNIRKIFLAKSLEEIKNELVFYDIIIATQVFEHLPKKEYETFLKILYSRLKNNGHLIITVPNMANPFTLCERYADITHKNGFTDNSLRELVKKHIPSAKKGFRPSV